MPDIINNSNYNVYHHVDANNWNHHPASVVNGYSFLWSSCEYQLQVAYKVQGNFIHDYEDVVDLFFERPCKESVNQHLFIIF